MKKITFFIALLFITFNSEAQVLISQSFDTALTWTASSAVWTRKTVGVSPSCTPFAGAGMAKFASYDYASGTTSRLTSPAIAFAGGSYRVKVSMFRDNGYPTDADNLKFYYNTTNTLTGATLLGTVNRSRSLAPTESTDGWYTYNFTIPGNPAANGYIIVSGTSAYGNNMYMDEISVQTIQTNDAQLSSIDLASVLPPSAIGNNTISGNINNLGLSPITSLDLNWQVDAGAIHTQSLSGLNITAGQTYAYSHQDQWNATPGNYSLRVWVSNINGGAVDGDITNDTKTKAISVASNQATRLPLYEKFSSSTCAPCGTFNLNYFDPFLGTSSTSLALISYQVNWPSTGDPYYTPEVGTRVSYYGVSGAPTLFVDAKDGTNFDSAALDSDLAVALNDPAYFTLSATKNLVGTDMSIAVTTTPYLTGTYRLYTAVVEKITTGNATTNGETEFHNVMMKMVPDAAGTVINCVADTPITTNLQVALTGLHIEEMTDLDVVVFVQNYATKQIMQAAYATELLSNNTVTAGSKFKLYPNPTTGILKIASDKVVNVEITDITGKVVYSMNNVTNETAINLSNLQKGIYLAKISGDNSTETQKVILK